MCVEVKRKDCTVVLNRGGAQLFITRKGIGANNLESGDNDAAMDQNKNSAQLVRKRNSDDTKQGESTVVPNERESLQYKKQKSNKPKQAQLDHD
jgi:hypothetical protein